MGKDGVDGNRGDGSSSSVTDGADIIVWYRYNIEEIQQYRRVRYEDYWKVTET